MDLPKDVLEELVLEYDALIAMSKNKKKVYHVVDNFTDKTPKRIMVIDDKINYKCEKKDDTRGNGLIYVVDDFESNKVVKILNPNK